MTVLKKDVRRVTNTTVRSQGKDRRLIVEIRAGATETIYIRESGRRTGFHIPIDKVYMLGCRLASDAARAEKISKRRRK